MDLVAGDVVLLCSDGLHSVVDEDRIAGVLSRESTPERACTELVRAANDAGGRDNVTVVVARYQDGARWQPT